MKKTQYRILGRDVSGYRIGEHLAIRDTLPDYRGPRDRKKIEAKGRWQLEHIPTSKIICRGATRAELVELVDLLGPSETDILDETDVIKVVDNIKIYAPSWYALIEAQRERMR